MQPFELWQTSDLQRGAAVQVVNGIAFTADSAANLFGVRVLDNGEPVELSGTVMGYAIRADGATLTITGSLSGNAASIVLPAAAYVVPGTLDIVLKISDSGTVNTLGAWRVYVQRSSTDTIVDPSHVIPSIEELLEQIDACEQATDAANDATEDAMDAAAAAIAAAAKLNGMTVSATEVTGSPTAAVSETGGHYHIAFGLVKGNTGDNASITGTAVSYQNSASGTVIPTGTWESVQPVTPQGQFLWVRTVLTWNNGQTTTLYSVSRQGMDGAGSVSSVNGVSPDVNGNVDLPVDSAPTAGSTSLITSGAVKSAIDNVQIDVDSVPTAGSSNPVSSGGTHAALALKQDLLTAPMAYLGENITGGTANDTRAFWAAQGTGYAYFSQAGQLVDQPYRWGFLINYVVNGDQVYQEFHVYSPHMIAYSRGGNEQSAAMSDWTNIAADYLAIVAIGDAAPQAITAGQYVVWNSGLYTARSNIASGATLSSSNLASVSNGGLNDLNSKINALTSTVRINYGSNSHVDYYKRGNIVHVTALVSVTDVTVTAWNKSAAIATLPAGFRPSAEVLVRGIMDRTTEDGSYLSVDTDGSVKLGCRYNPFSVGGNVLQATAVYATSY